MTDRSCANCACFARMRQDGSIAPPDSALADAQPICRRFPPQARQARVGVPVLDRNGQPVRDAKGGVRTEPKAVMMMGYPPVIPTAVCYDGWRPLGTLPGERAPAAANT